MTGRPFRAPARKPAWPLVALLAACVVSAPACAADAPRWWCPLAAPSASRSDAAIADALAHRQDTPHPMARVHTQGTLPHQGIHDESVRAERDWTIALDAAVAWRRTGQADLLRQVDRYLRAWADVYRPSFNPIDETNLDQLFWAYALTHDALAPATRTATARLIRALGEGYVQRVRQRRGSTYINDINNWQSHRIKLIATAAAALGDPAMLAAARELFLAQVAANIRADGSTVDFAQRDALHYVTYDLQPLVQAALAASAYPGQRDWIDAHPAGGASLADALAWLAPYAEGRRGHQEFVHTEEPFDIERRQAGLKGYDGAWDPHTSAALYAYAAVLLPAYRPLARRLGETPAALRACAAADAR
ncbi:hypothetical protein ASG87_15120 [Frateuria sp. Soil773]|uniref:alginate lyase family protein n=1 Tax=Frateuria sp. Soil773 TaxID=1736407 RepID=UPI0006F3F1BC|nr:alginate lyase family protein [Frateuria sp. Soil773]KRE97852.1 hypothetical protein ASG87_15120 [Frateuria sp. Soil773]